jgi:hypothetical protein
MLSNPNSVKALYISTVDDKLDVSYYGSSLRQTALNIIEINNLHINNRNLQVIEDLILRLIDSSFIQFISKKEFLNHYLTFIFSQIVQNPYDSSFVHPKEIFLFHNDFVKIFLDSLSFPIHPLMKYEINKVIKFLTKIQYTSFPNMFALFPIDQYYVTIHPKPFYRGTKKVNKQNNIQPIKLINSELECVSNI